MRRVWRRFAAGEMLGAIVQFRGQTPLNQAADLKKFEVRIMSTTPETIDNVNEMARLRAIF